MLFGFREVFGLPGPRPRARLVMLHQQAVADVARDESICTQCGGWKGRAPGTKPFCTASDCPGRFANQFGGSSSGGARSPLLSKYKTDPGTCYAPAAQRSAPSDDQAGMRARSPFTNPQRDDEEAARIKARAASQSKSSYSSPSRTASSPARPGSPIVTRTMTIPPCSCCALLLLLLCIVSLIAVAGALIYAVIRDDPNAPLTVALERLWSGRHGWYVPASGALVAVLLLLLVMCMLIFLRDLRRQFAQAIHRLIAHTLFVVNLLILFTLVLEPMLPSPGGTKTLLEVCADVQSRPPALRFDRDSVTGGPCFSFSSTWVVPMADESS